MSEPFGTTSSTTLNRRSLKRVRSDEPEQQSMAAHEPEDKENATEEADVSKYKKRKTFGVKGHGERQALGQRQEPAQQAEEDTIVEELPEEQVANGGLVGMDAHQDEQMKDGNVRGEGVEARDKRVGRLAVWRDDFVCTSPGKDSARDAHENQPNETSQIPMASQGSNDTSHDDEADITRQE